MPIHLGLNGAKKVLSLPLFEAGVLLVDHVQLSLSSHDFAIGAALLNGCPDFHTISLFASSHRLSAFLNNIIYTGI
jgi:hypothetical protein